MNDYQEFGESSQNDAPVRGFLHLPTTLGRDCLVLTHGAGANCDSPLLVALADAFCASGLIALRCDLPFRQLRAHGPPSRGSAERDQQGLRAAIASMRRQSPGRVFLVGHSYGGRQASMLAASEPGLVDQLLRIRCTRRNAPVSYERHTSLASKPLPCSYTARGIVSAPLRKSAALKLIRARTELLPVTGAGHELLTKRNRDEVSKIVVNTFLSFTSSVAG